MKANCPSFVYRRRRQGNRLLPTWTGVRQPTESSSFYRIQIVYTPPKIPKVFVLSPTLRKNARHRYGDGSLCLFYPGDLSWTPHHFIADTIVPWTSLWLYCYELWCDTGNWYAPEAPHRGKKK